MIRPALLLVAIWLVLELAGARNSVGILSGTMPGSALELAVGLVYVAAWFAATLVAPILAIAAGLSLVVSRPDICAKMAARARQWSATQRR
ncbi:MAG: hypothetical protein WBV82_09530 [Myxococcaceae bacterium]